MTNRAEIALARIRDPGRGFFEVSERAPVQDREKNPRGARHIDKTAQDRLPADRRPRVHDAQRRVAAMKASA